MDARTITELVVLLCIANGAPMISGALMRWRLRTPIDGGLRFVDGRPLLGPRKTLSGIVSAVLVTALTAPLFELSPGQGALFALLSMCGDLASSFLKRRLGIPASQSAPLLDQLPETVLPLWFMAPVLGETFREACAALLIFVAIDWLVSRLRDELSHDGGDEG